MEIILGQQETRKDESSIVTTDDLQSPQEVLLKLIDDHNALVEAVGNMHKFLTEIAERMNGVIIAYNKMNAEIKSLQEITTIKNGFVQTPGNDVIEGTTDAAFTISPQDCAS